MQTGAHLKLSNEEIIFCCETLHINILQSLLAVARMSGFFGCHEIQVIVFLCCARIADRRNSLNW